MPRSLAAPCVVLDARLRARAFAEIGEIVLALEEPMLGSLLLVRRLQRPGFRLRVVRFRFLLVLAALGEVGFARLGFLRVVGDEFARVALRVLRLLAQSRQRIELRFHRVERRLRRVDLG